LSGKIKGHKYVGVPLLIYIFHIMMLLEIAVDLIPRI
jgi:hypothetical protein